MDIAQRLELFFRRLAEAAPSATAEEALRLVCRLIDEVEEEFCPVAKQTPAPEDFTGRMYPPQADYTKATAGGGLTARTRRHRIVCTKRGAITIIHIETEKVVLAKKGKR